MRDEQTGLTAAEEIAKLRGTVYKPRPHKEQVILVPEWLEKETMDLVHGFPRKRSRKGSR